MQVVAFCGEVSLRQDFRLSMLPTLTATRLRFGLSNHFDKKVHVITVGRKILIQLHNYKAGVSPTSSLASRLTLQVFPVHDPFQDA